MAKKKGARTATKRKEIAASTTDANQKPMGLGEKADPTIVFVRQFRWTLSSQHLTEYFNRSVKIDYVKKQITVVAYSVVNSKEENILSWADNVHRKLYPFEFLVFDTYDGCGQLLSRELFDDISIVSHQVQYDYESSAPAFHEIVIGYGQHEIVGQTQRFEWEVKAKWDGYESAWFKTRLRERPSLKVEQTEVPHLNSAFHLPGRATWNPVNFSIAIDDQTDDKIQLLNRLSGQNEVDLELRLLVSNKTTQTWKLHNCRVSLLDVGDVATNVRVQFQQVTFESA